VIVTCGLSGVLVGVGGSCFRGEVILNITLSLRIRFFSLRLSLLIINNYISGDEL
jgi:hypothetical protein